jgi:multimeric flavodoxin WrbA
MKILLISSSPHKEKSDTFILAREVLKGTIAQGGQGDTIHLADCYLDFCRHCQECHKKLLHCSLEDSVPQILKAMLEAEGIIFASPNYINHITASLKALFERSTHLIHCKRLLGKYVAGVISSGSGQDQVVLDYLKYYAYTCGAQYSGGVSSSELTIKEKLPEAYQLGQRLAQDIKEKKVFPDQMKIIKASKEHFKQLIQLRKEEWPEEYKYWEDQGWL